MGRTAEIIEELTKLSEELVSIGNDMNNKLSQKDREVSDIYHFIEFNDLNACDGFKAYKNLQTVLRERREIKNEMELVNHVLTTANFNSVVEKSEQKMADMAHKVYTPRVRNDLFTTPNTMLRASTGKGKLLGEFSSFEKAFEYLQNNYGSMRKASSKKVIQKIQRACSNNEPYNDIVWTVVKSA